MWGCFQETANAAMDPDDNQRRMVTEIQNFERSAEETAGQREQQESALDCERAGQTFEVDNNLPIRPLQFAEDGVKFDSYAVTYLTCDGESVHRLKVDVELNNMAALCPSTNSTSNILVSRIGCL